MNRPAEIRGSLLARNTLLNLIGQGLPLVVAVATMPFIIRGLGTERFGVLALAWVVLGYFGIFDLGLGRATTKFVAEALGKGEQEEVPRLVWTAVTVQAVLGIVGGLVLVGITSLLVERILNIPPELIEEARTTFYLLALSVPIVLVSSSFRGFLEASQRFDLVNAVKIPVSSLTYLLPLVGLLLGFRLPGIVALILLARFGALVTFIALDIRLTPELKRYSGSLGLFPKLFSFGGWVTVTSIVGPILVYLDRFLIGSLLSMSAVAYYSAPYGMITRLGIIPGSLTMTLFPAFSALEGIRDRQKLGTLFARSIKYVLLALGPTVLVIGLFAKEILQIWLGADFAIRSTVVLQILAIGVFINSLASTPSTLLSGAGRPDIPAKFHMLELLIYVGVAWLLVSHWGIAGAAAAWTLRVAIDTLLLFWATSKVYHFSPRLLRANGTALAGLAFIILISMAYVIRAFAGALPPPAQALLIIVLLGFFAWFSWRRIMDASDRGTVIKMAKLWKKSESAT